MTLLVVSYVLKASPILNVVGMVFGSWLVTCVLVDLKISLRWTDTYKLTLPLTAWMSSFKNDFYIALWGV